MAQPEIEIDEYDLRELRKSAKRKAGGTTVASRRKGEKVSVSPLDGRAQHKTNRDVQLNVGVREEIKEIVAQSRIKYGLPMCVFVEEAIEFYARKLDLETESEGR